MILYGVTLLFQLGKLHYNLINNLIEVKLTSAKTISFCNLINRLDIHKYIL